MASEIAIAIISACSALIGAAIPTWFNYRNNVLQNKFNKERALLEKQKETYWSLISAMQSIINSANPQVEFKELQNAVLMVSIYGDNETSKSINNYYRALVESAKTMVLLNGQEHREYQTKILNSMRKNLGLEQLAQFEIIGFRSQV